MQLVAVSALLLSVVALVFATTIPEGSPDGLYTFTLNSTGHEVLTYHGTMEDLTSSKEPSDISARDFLSKRRAAAALLSRGLDKRDYQTCSVYTGLDYDAAVLGLASTCGVFGDGFSGNIAFQTAGATAYGCDYGGGNSCDFNHVLQFNSYLNEWCGPNSNAWWNIPEYKLSFGRTQGGTCFCRC